MNENIKILDNRFNSYQTLDFTLDTKIRQIIRFHRHQSVGETRLTKGTFSQMLPKTTAVASRKFIHSNIIHYMILKINIY